MSDELEPEEESSEPEVAGKDVDIPHYLFLKDEKVKAEARRAYALTCLTSEEGVLSPKYREEWPEVVHMLEHGVYPPTRKNLKAVSGD